MNKKIDTIIFDVGGVLLPDYTDYIKNDISQFLGVSREQVDTAWALLIPELGKGYISEKEFWKKFCEETKCSYDLDTTDLLTREMKKRHAPFSYVSDIVRTLKSEKYKLGIISDTIKPHVQCYVANGLFDNFDTKVLSFEVGLRKPDPKIFQIALDKLNSKPENTLYIDDNVQFVEASRKMGFNAIVFTNDLQLKNDLMKFDIDMKMEHEPKQSNIGVHALLITKDGKVLLQKKTNDYGTENAGKISMFGGTLNVNEDPLAGLKRELLEELELNVDDYRVEKLNTYMKNRAIDGVDHEVNVFVIYDVNESLLTLHEGEAIISEELNIAIDNTNITRITKLALQDFSIKKDVFI